MASGEERHRTVSCGGGREECGLGSVLLPGATEREEDEDPMEKSSAEDKGHEMITAYVNVLWEKVSCKGDQQNGMPAATNCNTKEGFSFVLKTAITRCAVLMGIVIQGYWPCQHS